MGQSGTQDFGGPSLDLTENYYDGPEPEKIKFVQYCEKELEKSSADGNVSSHKFLELVQKYCHFRNMRRNVCRAADALTFASLPKDVQLAFVNERCSGPRDARLRCLDVLIDENDIIFVPEEWKYGICSATYPLAVSYDTSTAIAEEHTFSTKGLEEKSSSLFGTDPNKGVPAGSDVIINMGGTEENTTSAGATDPKVVQKSYSGKVPENYLHTPGNKSGGGAKPNIFHYSDSYQTPTGETRTPAEMAVSSYIELPTTRTTPYESKKKGSGKAKKSDEHTLPSVTQQTKPPVLRRTLQPSIAPVELPVADVAEESLPDDGPFVDSVPSFAPTPQSTIYTTEFVTTTSPSPSRTMYSVQSFQEESIVPIASRNDPPGGSVDRYHVLTSLLGILFIPVLLILFVKAYHRYRDPRRNSHELALVEDLSVISENSAILVAVGSTFKKSDDLSLSDLESNSSSAFIGRGIGLTRRIRNAFNRMHDFMDNEGSNLAPPPPPPLPPHERGEFRESRNVSTVSAKMKGQFKPDLEVFRPNQSSSSEETIGIVKIDPGTVLFPSDEVYVREFAPSTDNSEGTIPIMYQLDPSLTRKIDDSSVEPNYQSIHHATPAVSAVSPYKLPTDLFYLLNKRNIRHVQSRGNEPVFIAHSTSTSFEDSTTDTKSKTIRVDVLREEKSDNDFRIVGLAREGSDSSNNTSQLSVPFDEEEEPLPSRPDYYAGKKQIRSTPRNNLTPRTFERLSNQLDEMMEGINTNFNLRPNPSLGPRRSASSGNLLSVSSMSRSASFSGSDETPLIGNSLFRPRYAYNIDVLGEQRQMPSPSRADRNSSATGSWIDDIEGYSASVGLSEAPSVASSSTRDDVEVTLTETGNVVVTTTRSSRAKRLEMINMYPLD